MTAKESWDGNERRNNPSPWCVEHHSELKDIWLSIRGNGHPEDGLVFKTKLLLDRQESIKNFIDRVDRAFWWLVATSLIGVVSALGAFIIVTLRLLMEHGKI
jgi:hypothetical protein